MKAARHAILAGAGSSFRAWNNFFLIFRINGLTSF
jgi:hypothetical protein